MRAGRPSVGQLSPPVAPTVGSSVVVSSGAGVSRVVMTCTFVRCQDLVNAFTIYDLYLA